MPSLRRTLGVGFVLSPTPTSFRGGSGRSPPPGLASHAARPNHRGAERLKLLVTEDAHGFVATTEKVKHFIWKLLCF